MAEETQNKKEADHRVYHKKQYYKTRHHRIRTGIS